MADIDHRPTLGRFTAAVRSTARLARYGMALTHLACVLAWCHVVRRERTTDVLAREIAPLLARMGATPVKLGQLVASAPGSFPPEIVAACSELRDRVAPDPLDIEKLLATELGDLVSAFAAVIPTPVAAASIAQVYRATLVDGHEVAIKVRRPGVASALEADVRLLRRAARLAARLVPAARRLGLAETADGLADLLTAELDFEAERDNAAFLGQALEGSGITVPVCVEELCTRRILVMSFLPGTTVSAGAGEVVAAGKGTEVARQIVAALLWPLASVGVFHADMHGGNLVVDPGGRLGMVDFGSVCVLDADVQVQVAQTFRALFNRRFDQAALAMLSLVDTSNADLTAAQAALATLAALALDHRTDDVPLGYIAQQLLSIAANHGLTLPVTLTTLLRQLVLLDGVLAQLESTFDFFAEGATILDAATAYAGASRG